ncbi:ead/Ea22-like family protein [Enterobacter soli]
MSNIDKQALREAAANAKIAGEAPVMPFDQRITALNDFMKHCTPATVLALLDELEELQSFRTAFTEWLDKTEWVQSDKRFDVIIPWGKHRADVLKLYVEHLESKQEAAEKRIAELERSESQLIGERDDSESALNDAYKAVMGQAPEWSNWFSFADAIDEIELACGLWRNQTEDVIQFRARIAELEARKPDLYLCRVNRGGEELYSPCGKDYPRGRGYFAAAGKGE